MHEPFNPAYVGARDDIEALLDAPRTVLDVGCSVGTLGASIKARTGARVVGIEMSEPMGAQAGERLDEVFVGDAERLMAEGALAGRRFDTIIFADVLEHLVDPWRMLRSAVALLEPGGSIIASIPNVRHLSTIWDLTVNGRWPMRDRGIHDRTHLRFFTRADIIDLMTGVGLHCDEIRANYRLLERPHDINRHARRFAFPGLREFLAFQYLVRARLAVPTPPSA